MPQPPARTIAAAVREHDSRLGGLIRANPYAILIVDSKDRVEMCNPAFERLFGYREADIMGEAIDTLIVPPELTSEAAGLSRCGFEGKTARAVTRRRTKDGSLVDVELTIVPLTGEGLPVGAYGIYRDLTEQRRAEHQLRAQYAVVEALAHSSTIEEAAPWVLRAVAEAVGWQVGAMWIVDKTANQLRCVDIWHAAGVNAQQFEAETRKGVLFAAWDRAGPGRSEDPRGLSTSRRRRNSRAGRRRRQPVFTRPSAFR